MSLCSWRAHLAVILLTLQLNPASAFIGNTYRLDTEYSGLNFFDGWDFYSDRDPTGGLVTYYSKSSAQLTGLIQSSADGPAYMGVNSVDVIPFDFVTGAANGAGRPSVRIASKKAWTHGLFIGDFAHAPVGVCGTWPAFWTLGPNWPYTGEIDIMEGVNLNTKNIMSLHTNETCIINGDQTTMTGTLENTNCAYYPDYNVGCGVQDTRTDSFGADFNLGQGGVFATQWTSEYIRIWFWPRVSVPSDIGTKRPDPGSWGLPTAELAVGNCTVDQHFQQHKIIFDTTFCGEYAGNKYVWNSTDANSCAAHTGLSTCDNYVANNPAAFANAYWEVNSVQVYQLVDPQSDVVPTSYVASEQAASATNVISAPTPLPTLNISSATLCPSYNFSIISDGTFQYEVACDYDPPGPDIIGQPYQGFTATSLEDCVQGCTYMNINNGTNTCGAVSHNAAINFCYFKKYIDGAPMYRPGYNEIRLIYYGYPQITDNPLSQEVTATSIFADIYPTPQTYRPLTTITKASVITSIFATSKTTTVGIPALGNSSTPAASASSASKYSLTATLSGATLTTTSAASGIATTSLTSASTITSITTVISTSNRAITSSLPELFSSFTSSDVPGTSTDSNSDIQTSPTVPPLSSADPFTLSLSSSSTSNTLASTVSSASTAIFTSSSLASTATPDVPPSTAQFIYAGCFGVTNKIASMVDVTPISNTNMTVEYCVSVCTNHTATTYYIGVRDFQCFCGTAMPVSTDLVSYPDVACSIACPGNVSESCGGNVDYQGEGPASTTSTAMSKRQAVLALISLYNNTNLLPGSSDGTGQSSIATPSVVLSTTTAMITASPTGPPSSFPASQVSYNVTGTNTITVISTTFVDTCDTCPGGLTTSATTITIPHCGCTATFNTIASTIIPVASPAVPMTTTAKSCNCGEGGATSSITVTIPHTSSIAELQASTASQNIIASTSASVHTNTSTSTSTSTASRFYDSRNSTSSVTFTSASPTLASPVDNSSINLPASTHPDPAISTTSSTTTSAIPASISPGNTFYNTSPINTTSATSQTPSINTIRPSTLPTPITPYTRSAAGRITTLLSLTDWYGVSFVSAACIAALWSAW